MIDNNESAIQAEQSVIGSLLMLSSPESQLVIKTMGMLKAGSFYKLYNRQIFKSIKALFVMGENIDSLTVEVQCKKQGVDDDGLFMYLAQTMNNTPSSSNVIGYAKIVRECSIERFANQKLQDLMGMFNDHSEGDVYQRLGLLETAITDISSIGMRNESGGLKHINEAAVKWLDNIDEIHASGFDKNKLTTGIESIDEILGVKGMVRGSLVGVAARPKMGKTAFMSLMINHISLQKRR